ncbi:MAG: hypothetical protein LQ349_005756 [Xanthoria aureola]|nr:MAG: hypothetical protein LQ349_005756 [Xanthoria aureola]
MSFGFGVGDFIAVGTLAWKVYNDVYKAAKDAPESFQKVHHDVLSLHAVLKEAGEIIFDPPLSPQRQQRLQTIADGCTSVLGDLQTLVMKYEEMGTQGKLTWKRLGWGSEDIVEYRLRITSSVTMLNTFMSTSRYITEQKLEKYLREIQSGKREGSIVSVQTVDSLSMEDRAAWRAIRKDLESVGITAEAYDANRAFIRDWLIRALDTGALDEQAVPADEKDETPQLGSSPPLELFHLVPNSHRTYSPTPEGEAFSTTDSRSLGVLKAKGKDVTIGLEPSAPVGHPSVVSTSSRSFPSIPGEALPKVPVSGRETRKAGDISKLTVKNQTVSRVAALVAMISRPNARLLHLVNSTGPEESPHIALLLQNPAKRRVINADTIKEAFFTAVVRGYSDTVTEFLNDGQIVDTVFACGKEWSYRPRAYQISALMLAVLYGIRATVQVLLRWGADVNFTGKYRSDLLGRKMLCRLYLPRNLTPLGCAVKAGSLDVVRMLLDAGADPRQDMDGRTALHEASTTLIVRELLGRGADIHQVCNLDGTPLQAAIRYRRYEVVYSLIEYGASATEATCPEPRRGHKTPLEVAMYFLGDCPRQLQDESLKVVDLLREKGAVMDAQQSEKYQRLKDLYNRDGKVEL